MTVVRITGLLVVVAAALIAVRWAGLLPAGGHSQPPLSTPANSDYYMTDATIHQMNADGELAYRMTLGQTLHFPDDSARITDIAVHYRTGSKTYWDITAARGRVPAHSHNIYLYAGVAGRHPEPGGGAITHVNTDHAWVYTDAKRLETRARVVARAPGRRITGDGMTVDLKTDQLKLRHNVHVTYTR